MTGSRRLVILSLYGLLAVPAALRGQAGPAGPQYRPPALPAGTPSTAPVRVDGGLVSGGVLPSGVHAFRGIPFAAPPTGALRWRPPQPVRPWRGVRAATRFGPRCMQLPIFGDMVFRSDGMSEDCLDLNVWAPPRAAGRKLPVLLYFFGGGFLAGDGSEYRYDGESLARRGIVVVTANYRLGAFGFLALPALTAESPRHASGNYGLLDQVAALRWVRANIAAFGGDPSRITIGGESAGSISVCALMASPLARGRIAGAIGESGGMIQPTFAPVPLDSAERRGLAFADSVRAGSLAALRALPGESLLDATARPGDGRFPVAVDGWFLPRTPAAIFAAGEQARVPLLAGWNSEESDWRALLGSAEPTPQAWAGALRKLFGSRADEAQRLFPGDSARQVVASGTLLAGARFIAYSTWKWAELHGHTGQPVFRYLFVHPRPAPIVPGPNPPPTGAIHSAEIEYALGNLHTNSVYAWAPADDTVSAAVEEYFANFVKTGDPNGAGLPPWPAAYADDAVRVMVLDVHPHAERAADEAAYRFLDQYYAGGSPGR